MVYEYEQLNKANSVIAEAIKELGANLELGTIVEKLDAIVEKLDAIKEQLEPVSSSTGVTQPLTVEEEEP